MTGHELPLVIEGDGTRVSDRVRADRQQIRKNLTTHGAVLFRGFEVGGVDGFAEVVRELSGAPLTYEERSSPRSVIKGNVYTSTDYPPQEEIFLHNENSYQATWPMVLYFYCLEPPTSQGATPLASTRAVHDTMDPRIREEFERRGWMVVRNYGDELGMSWRQVFNTDSRDEVTDYCRRNGVQAEWLDGDRLRTRAVRRAVHRHPVTGAPVWFNHATFFHISTLPEGVRLGLLEMCGEENLPSNTYYGDGGTIPDDVAEHLRDRYRAASVRFDYRRDDLLVVDNMLASHGREPFTGPRKIAVAMAEPSSA
ncbi:TauD/TfdA family dioxygenase [Streptosporangium sp. NPDC050855]|uniref:TauD/TfdA family dioxygenase n=1 Tax=Streptosporangium sp. NPDC050855 TaxID=3366194 RepID=UPI00378CD81B